MISQSGETTMADRGALGIIGLLLGAATLLVMITAAVVVSVEVQSGGNVPAAAAVSTIAR
jgi:hypothetical protein